MPKTCSICDDKYIIKHRFTPNAVEEARLVNYDVCEGCPKCRKPFHSDGLIGKAYEFAKSAHKGVERKYTKDPYFVHVVRVAGLVAHHPLATKEMIAAAYLHDVVEDVKGINRLKMDELFGRYIMYVVEQLTNRSKFHPYNALSRSKRKTLDFEHIEKTPIDVKIIKLCDRLDNIKDIGLAEPDYIILYCNETKLLLKYINEFSWDRNETLTREILGEVNKLLIRLGVL